MSSPKTVKISKVLNDTIALSNRACQVIR
jgi:3'-phosphoadenosine 5'-phosphosulfate (PAPS) 3'-phosphatase